jgi:hypothetical protein
VKVINSAVWMGHKLFNDTLIFSGYLALNDE